MRAAYFIELPADAGDLLAAWQWLVPASMRMDAVTVTGDAFLRDDDESIHWLDVGAGDLTHVADSPADFEQALTTPAAEEWLLPKLVARLRERWAELPAGKCYGFILPPCVGGTFKSANFEPTALALHFGLVGQMHEKNRTHPDGTPIGGFSDEETRHA